MRDIKLCKYLCVGNIAFIIIVRNRLELSLNGHPKLQEILRYRGSIKISRRVSRRYTQIESKLRRSATPQHDKLTSPQNIHPRLLISISSSAQHFIIEKPHTAHSGSNFRIFTMITGKCVNPSMLMWRRNGERKEFYIKY